MKIFLLIICSICSVTAQNLLEPISTYALAKAARIADDIMETIKDLYVVDDDGNQIPIDINQLLYENIWQTEKALPDRVFFYLYTRKNPTEYQQLYIDDVETLKNSSFDMQKETKIVTHGWLNNYKSSACVDVRNAFLENSDCNVIAIDWGKISLAPYIWASDRVAIVGKFAAKMVSFLESQGLNENNLTIVGHSLGAHVAGLTSYYATRKANYVVQLDPAQLNFHKVKFASGQGKFVEVIHSNAALAGAMFSLGDADFWPNGGWQQPGCNLDILGLCSHFKSVKYFAESINSKVGFVGVQCPSYPDYKLNKCSHNPTGIMGGAKPQPGLKGNYYFETNDKAPFAKGPPQS